MNIRFLRSALALAGLIPLSAHAADPGAIQRIVDGAIQPLMATYDIAGMAVAVTVDGHPMVFNYGYASKQDKKPVNDRTLFELGSVSKTFTATLACVAQERGLLSFEAHPSQYWLALRGSALDRANLLQLATYTAGGLPLQVPDEIKNNAQMLAWFQNWQPDAAPGARRLYSNPSIGLFGHLAAMALKTDFAKALGQEVFAGLGLQHSYVHVPAAASEDYAWGYDKANQPVRARPDVLDVEAYGVKSSAADMIQYVEAHIAPERQPERMRRALDCTHVAYFQLGDMLQGLGWEQYQSPLSLPHLLAGNSEQVLFDENPVQALTPPQAAPSGTLLNKTGSTRGFGAYVAFIPSQRIGIVLLANKNYPIPARVTAAHSILEQLGAK